jgi:hypothetical protein
MPDHKVVRTGKAGVARLVSPLFQSADSRIADFRFRQEGLERWRVLITSPAIP